MRKKAPWVTNDWVAVMQTLTALVNGTPDSRRKDQLHNALSLLMEELEVQGWVVLDYND